MNKTLLTLSMAVAGSALATPFTGNDAPSNAMGNTGVASARPQDAFQFNPGLLADYSDSTDFGLTLPSIKFFIDDSLGLLKAGEEFFTGGTLSDFQNIDVDALNVAVQGNGGSEVSMTDVFANIAANMATVVAEVGDIQADIDDNDSIDDNSNITDLQTASTNLTTNTTLLTNKITVAQQQSTNVSPAVSGAIDAIISLNNKPLQLGLGIDILNVALPSNKLGLAFSLSTNSTIGVNLGLSSSDANLLNGVATDLVSLSTNATSTATQLNELATATQAMTDHIATVPVRSAFAVGPAGDAAFATALSNWGDQLQTYTDTVNHEQDDVNAELDTVTSFDGEVISTTGSANITVPTVEELKTTMEIVGANISEVGLSFARQFEFKGEYVAIGITPKLQSINIFEKTFGLATFEDDLSQLQSNPMSLLEENSTQKVVVNADIGAAKSWDFYGKVRAGVALKDIIPWTLESDAGTELLIRPKLRVGGAHQTKFTKVAIDLDITENKPLKYGVPTRYFGIGGELNAFGWAAVRAGYRNNLSVEDSSVISGGLGLTPFGTGLDFSAWAKPTFDDPTTLIQDVGFVVQFSVNF